MAALVNGLPKCHRVKPNGQPLIIQKCKAINITVSAKRSACGFEPFWNNHTIGRDGISLHPFQSCFWKDGMTYIDGKSYVWKNKTWTEIKADFNFSSLKLLPRLNESTDLEFKYFYDHHRANNRPEYEQLNVIN